jgi:cytoskeletal protein RodZ
MHQELIQLGATIKKRREERSLSLKEVENATSIRLSYLQAIEEGHLGKLISPIYAQGFITKYALFLELDAEKLLKEHPYVMKILSEKQASTQEFTLGIGTLEVRGSPGGEVKWLPNFIWVGVSVVAILTGWFLARYLGIF